MENNLEWLKHKAINKSEIARRMGLRPVKFNSKLNNRIFDKLKNPKQKPIINHFNDLELAKLEEIKLQVCKELFTDILNDYWEHRLDKLF